MSKKKNPPDLSIYEQIEPKCPHFYTIRDDGSRCQNCGGCSFMNIDYADQLKVKEKMVHDLIAPVISEETWQEVWEGIKPSPVLFEYRNKVELSFGDEYKGGPLTLGMHKKNSFFDIVDVKECVLIDADMRAIRTATVEYFREKEISQYRRNTRTGNLRHMLLRKATTGEILVDLVTPSYPGGPQNGGDSITPTSGAENFAEILEGWKDRLLSLSLEGEIKGILNTVCDRDADVVEDQGTKILFGQPYFTENLLNLDFAISPFSFFQTNSKGAEVLYSLAREYILGENQSKNSQNDGEIANSNFAEVFDLYSGTGTIAQVIAPAAGHVTGVELIPEAVEAAKDNAKLNGLDNCTFLAGDVLKVIDEIEEKPDFIILDPPRDGIHPKALPKLLKYGVDNLIYIACKPGSLARDLDAFLYHGYKPMRLACVDLFPQTPHIETVCLLTLNS